MSFNSLFWNCLERNATSLSERRKSARIERQRDELVLVFNTDNRAFQNELGTQRISDGLFVYKNLNQAGPLTLIFCELKGSNTDRAVEQLRDTIRAMRTRMFPIFGQNRPICKAVIVYTGSAPRKLADFVKEFNDSFQTRLVAKSGGSVDLREFL